MSLSNGHFEIYDTLLSGNLPRNLVYVVQAVMNSAVEVKTHKGDLVEVGKQHFNSLYPQLADFSEHGTVMCPPIFSFKYKGPIGEASGATPLLQIEEDSLRGDTAELKIFKMLEECNMPMFVISNLIWSNFIQEVVHQRLPKNHPSLSYMAETLKTAKEADFVIIHQKIGVILFEVKAKFRKDTYRTAKDQLNKAEQFIQALLLAIRDEGGTSQIEIPILKVVAMPNDKTYNSHATAREPTLDSSKSGTNTGCEKTGEVESTLNSDGVSSKPDFIDLREENLDSLENFLSWWQEQFVKRPFDEEQERALHTLLSILVSQRTEIKSSCGRKELSDGVLLHKMLADINKDLTEGQHFLERSHKKERTKNPKKKVVDTEVVVKTNDNPNLGILEKKFLFLNREQFETWEGPYRQVFSGAPGCGKTILLQFKALECARKGEKVQIFVPDPLMNLYKNFFCGQQNVYVHKLRDLGQIIIDHDSHCFVDEFQLVAIYVDTDPGGKQERSLKKNLESKCKDRYFWIACNDVQFFPCAQIPGFESQLWGWFSEKLKELETMTEFYCPTEMKTVVRYTREIHDFVQEHLSKAGISRPEGATALSSIKLGHQICGPPVKVLNFKGNFIAENCATLIKEEIEGWPNYNDVAVLVSSAFSQKELFVNLLFSGIPVCKVGSDENAVVIDSVDRIHSYQWPFVIVVSNSNPEYSVQNYTMFTRAVAKLVVIYYS